MRISDCRSDVCSSALLAYQSRVERSGNQVIGAEGHVLVAISTLHDLRSFDTGKIGERLDAGDLHLLVDGRRPDVERAPQDEGKAEDVVDLVRVVGATRRDDGVGPGGAGLLGRSEEQTSELQYRMRNSYDVF